MASISQDEEKAAKEFIKIVNDIRRQHNAGPMSFNTALKFMMARKFDVHRALSLYEAHEITRFKEGLAKFDPFSDPVKSELETGKFTVLPTRDSSGAAIAMFTACKHIPTDTSHQTTLQGVVYQLDIALEDLQTQRCGIVFIYNMTNSKYANFDYELSQKILGLLKGAYPARLKKVLIVTAPLWFKAPFKILRLFVREKLRDRVFMVNVSQLPLHIPLASLPKELGGQFEMDHVSWIKHCLESAPKNVADLYDLASNNKFPLSSSNQLQNGAILSVNCTNNMSAADCDLSHIRANGNMSDDEEDSSTASTKLEQSKCVTSDENHKVQSFQHKPKPENIIMPNINDFKDNLSSHSHKYSTNESIHSNIQGMSLEEFIQYMKSKGRKGLCEEYNEIKSKTPEGTFEISRLKVNQCKNRYTDVLCFDHSMVKLDGKDGDESSYINANFVDGYMQKNAFISTQGPLPKTFVDFWRMVWQQQVLIIVMTTRTVERCRTKCGQYWPLEKDTSMECGFYKIENTNVEQHSDYVITYLILTDTKTGLKRNITHLQYTSWPDYGVPHSAVAMLDFREKVREHQIKNLKALGSQWQGHPSGPPIVVHCSAGTFITLDISILRLEATGTINIKETVEKIRSQRAHSIQMPDQYVFCYLALLEYAFIRGLLQDVDLSGFEDSESEFEE
ncbi:tyrosine-protein phosphatase non-receptor type 9-like protein [Dinothrombium tinctorium]|uniref:Tyrosine-protein phosphatase non-receptor type 9 n=1 Tax=Dinothrombium tinctorium TaxID=1965070 RepID=A0A3S3QBJ5_9ACAR|nr:tyrosine-protein phosphatase non-receptor type 9-like protein [Dinothrombium tinctorium]RWS17249.1 tyrosine-protein phosphatase non-receptor type 9-like protein [Dinothrombium tinctorium]RWS17264.1 tyrosine-protein phosphatase non-receptor type 9-like protein [Dinothrombium tinctorium]